MTPLLYIRHVSFMCAMTHSYVTRLIQSAQSASLLSASRDEVADDKDAELKHVLQHALQQAHPKHNRSTSSASSTFCAQQGVCHVRVCDRGEKENGAKTGTDGRKERDRWRSHMNESCLSICPCLCAHDSFMCAMTHSESWHT